MADDPAHALLAILVGPHPTEEIATVLHADVVLRRGDGTALIGRPAVMAMFHAPDDGIRYSVVDARGGVVKVAMSAPGMPGAVRFALLGEVLDGVLISIHVRVGDD